MSLWAMYNCSPTSVARFEKIWHKYTECTISTAVASPVGCPRPDLWGKRDEAEGMVDTA